MEDKVQNPSMELDDTGELARLTPVCAAIAGLPAPEATPARGRSRNLEKVPCRRVRSQAGLYRDHMLELAKRFPGDLKAQIAGLMEVVTFQAATGVVRESSFATSKSTKARWITFVGWLKKSNMPVPSLDKIGAKHVRAMIEAMEAKGRKASYMANMLTALRRLLTWAGKPGAVAALEDLVREKENARRSIVAVAPRTLESQGIDPEHVFRLMDAECKVAGLLLRLMFRFGLRPKEAVCLAPHVSDLASELWVVDGSKGGLERRVPVESMEQRELLDECKRRVPDKDGHLTDAWGKLHQALTRLYYLARKIGLHANGTLGTTMYGFRRAYALRVYEDLSGEKAPVLGGKPLPRQEQLRVETEVSTRLGHKRRRMAAAYIGSHYTTNKVQRDQEEKLLKKFSGEELRLNMRRSGLTRLLVVGQVAEGRGGDAETFAWEGVAGAAPSAELLACLDRIAGRKVTLQAVGDLRGQATFEVA